MQHETSERKLQEELQSKFLEIEITTKTLNDIKNLVNNMETEIKSLTNQVVELQTENETLNANLAVSLVENKEIKEEFSDSLKNISHLNITIDEKECQIDQLKTLIQNFTEEKMQFDLRNTHQVQSLHFPFI